ARWRIADREWTGGEPRRRHRAASVHQWPGLDGRVAGAEACRRTPGARGSGTAGARQWSPLVKPPLADVQPLAGRVIVITRAKDQTATFRALLEEAGARVLIAPTIVIEPPLTWAPLDDALSRLPHYQWVIFTSVNGVEMVRRRLEAEGRAAEALGSARIAA